MDRAMPAGSHGPWDKFVSTWVHLSVWDRDASLALEKPMTWIDHVRKVEGEMLHTVA